MIGIASYGAYVPYHRLDRAAITAALAQGGGRGTRAVASYDEDATSMGVEAARAALGPTPLAPDTLFFATSQPPYLDKTNATAVHVAAGLPRSGLAVDVVGSVRSGIGALLSAARAGEPALAVLSDVRGGRPGGADEAEGGDGAAALLFADLEPDQLLASLVGTGSVTEEFLDRWRLPGDGASRRWEERFGEHVYVPLGEEAFTDALKSAGVTAGDIDHLIVVGTHARAIRAVARTLGTRPEVLVDDLTAVVGNTGTAHAGLLLASVLDRAQPGETIALLSLADGADALIFVAQPGLADFAPRPVVERVVAQGTGVVPYPTFLTWRGELRREPPRRPDPQAPAGPPSSRSARWKFAFEGSRCEECGTRHLPPARVCVECHTADRMVPERLADVPARVVTYTVDRLAFSLSPPVVAAVVDFEGGGRFQCELTDVDPAEISVGDEVTMTFRRVSTANGVHNYFWKARPIRRTDGKAEGGN